MRNRWFVGVGLALLVLVGSFVCSNGVFADAFDDSERVSIKSKAALEGVYNCWWKGAYNLSWKAENGGATKFMSDSIGNDSVKLPYGLTDATDNNADCKQILFGWSYQNIDGDSLNDGLIPKSVSSDDTDAETIAKYFSGNNYDGVGGLGYTAKQSDNVEVGQEAQQLTMTLTKDESDGLSEGYCYDANGNPEQITLKLANGDETYSEVTDNKLIFPTITSDSNGSFFQGKTAFNNEGNVPDPHSATIQEYEVCGVTFYLREGSTVGNDVYYEFSGNYNSEIIIGSANGEYYVSGEYLSSLRSKNLKFVTESTSTSLNQNNTGHFTDYDMEILPGDGAMNLMKGLNETNNIGYKLDTLEKYSDLALTPQEVVDLYKYYLATVYGVPIICDDDDYFDAYSNSPDVRWKKDHECKAVVSSVVDFPDEKVYGVDGEKHFTKEIEGYQEVLDKLNSINIDNLDDSYDGGAVLPGSSSDGSGSTDDGDVVEQDITCANSGGAMSLGWIVCPVLEWLGNAANDAYEDYVEPSLRVSPQLFNPAQEAENNGVRGAWEMFRNIANVLFIILFLLVIFSQLTGVGIDNYGIKKILPKLIVVAILINLSYVLCLICVDLSNILGNALRSMFDALSAGLSTPPLQLEGVEGDQTILPTVLTGVGLLVVLVGVVGAIWKNPAIILSLLVAALGVAIAVFFLFVLLAVREAALVVLVAVSPLAVASYMLPNTKKLFDRWSKLFQGLLLVYPICGLLVGGGNYVSKLLLSAGFAANGFLKALTAMIVGIVPIFFIPTVLKSSLAAMGKVGGMLTGLGDAARKGTTKRLRDSEGYRNAQRMGLERKTRLRAGLDKEGNLTKIGELRARRSRLFGSASARRQAARVQQAKKTIGEAETANAVLSGALAATGIAKANDFEVDGMSDTAVKDFFGRNREDGSLKLTKDQKYYYSDFLKSANKGSKTGMNASIQAMKASGMKDKDIAKIMRFAINNGQIRGMSSEQKAQWMRETSQAYGNDFLASDFELGHYMRTGGTGNGGVLGDYGRYAQDAPIDIDEIKPEDLIRLSGDSLAAMAAAGKITQAMAQRVVAMNSNISEDKKVMFGALASGKANANTITNGGTVGLGDAAANFKNDAGMLMNNHSATAGTEGFNNTIQGTDADMVQAWTSATPQDVNVVQNFQGGGRQYDPVRAVLDNGTAGVGAGGAGGSGITLGGSIEDAARAAGYNDQAYSIRNMNTRNTNTYNSNTPSNMAHEQRGPNSGIILGESIEDAARAAGYNDQADGIRNMNTYNNGK